MGKYRVGDMMAKRRAFLDIIKKKGALVLDGGLGSELERYGCDLQHKLWSAKVLMDQPDVIKKIHISYLAAGADIIQSSGYQATVAGFKGLGLGTEEAIELVKLSVRLAVQARNEFVEAKASGALTLRGIKLGEETADGVKYFSEGALPKPLVAASVGPYGAFLADGSEYRGYPDVQTEYLEVFHIPRLALFAEENPDILSFETIPSYDEAIAIARAMSDPYTSRGTPGWIAFSCKDEHHVSSGETIIKCAEMIDKVRPITGLGINCTKPEYVESLVKDIRTVTDKPIAVYPNLGESYDSETKTWYGDPGSFVDYVDVWRAAGANIIGGCCRTTPEIIGDIAKKIHK